METRNDGKPETCAWCKEEDAQLFYDDFPVCQPCIVSGYTALAMENSAQRHIISEWEKATECKTPDEIARVTQLRYEWLEAWQEWSREHITAHGLVPDNTWPDDTFARTELGRILQATAVIVDKLTCLHCEQETVTESWQRHEFDYGVKGKGPLSTVLTVYEPLQVCGACGEGWLDYRSEAIRDAAVQAYLDALGPPYSKRKEQARDG